MKCSHCHNNEANTHITQIINGEKIELFLCDECAKELGYIGDFGLLTMDDFFGDLLGAGVSSLNSLSAVDRCGACGSSFNDIISSGRVGCADCYSKYEDKLASSIEKLHGKAKHIGKFVTYTKDDESSEKEPKISSLDRMKSDLDLAIKEQRFEDAAVLRDKIRDYEQGAI